MDKPHIAINLVVLNGEKYIQGCLESIRKQDYTQDQIELNILDNGSTDQTISLIESFLPNLSNVGVTFTKSTHNFGMWGGQEELLKHTRSEYLVVLSVDVILAPDFLSQAVRGLEKDNSRGAIQGKIYQFTPSENYQNNLPTTFIDTCGFEISRSRRIGNIGHGEEERGQYNSSKEIFGVEGAVPVFRTEAFRSIKVAGEIADHDLFWYGEDLDVAWRLRLAGWSQWYEPSVIAWHDRQTTKNISRTFSDFRSIRKSIPLRKRRLEWRNIRCTIIKNDYIINLVKDVTFWLPREVAMTGYLLLFEPAVLLGTLSCLRLLPRMLSKRRAILSKAKASPSAIHAFFV